MPSPNTSETRTNMFTTGTITLTCPYPDRNGKPCPTRKGPYSDRKMAQDAMNEHFRAQHAETLEPMASGHNSDKRMRIAAKPDAGYEAPTW